MSASLLEDRGPTSERSRFQSTVTLEMKSVYWFQAKTETRINFRDELETEEYRVAAIRLDK